MQLLRHGNTEGQKWAAGALGNLTVNSDNDDAIAKAGIVEPLVSVLQQGDLEGQKWAAGALCNLADNANNQIVLDGLGYTPEQLTCLYEEFARQHREAGYKSRLLNGGVE